MSAPPQDLPPLLSNDPASESSPPAPTSAWPCADPRPSNASRSPCPGQGTEKGHLLPMPVPRVAPPPTPLGAEAKPGRHPPPSPPPPPCRLGRLESPSLPSPPQAVVVVLVPGTSLPSAAADTRWRPSSPGPEQNLGPHLQKPGCRQAAPVYESCMTAPACL